jgi:hypothetical protein
MDAVRSDDSTLIRQSLRCLATVGEPEALGVLRNLLQHHDANVTRDANTCIFEIEHRSGEEVDP